MGGVVVSDPAETVEAYARRALDDECSGVKAAPVTKRNNTLNTAAFCLGQLVAAGALDRGEVEQRLLEAAAKYIVDDGEAAARATIRSGLDDGSKQPRDLSHLGASPNGQDDERPVIKLTADFHQAVDAAIEAVSGQEDVYKRANSLCRVVRHKQTDSPARGVKREPGAPIITRLTPATARTVISRVARFQGWNERKKDWVGKAPPKDLAESVLGEQFYPKARELVGVIEAPTLRPDGSLLWTPGYDQQTGLLYIPNSDYPPVPERPTKDEVKKAADSLLYLIVDFPMRSDADKAAWLASVLTLIVRGAITGPVPAFLVSSNLAGTGKTWLALLAGLIASGRNPAMDGYPEDPLEMEKILVGLAIAGDRCIVFDNVANGTAVGCAPLDRAIMARGAFRGRILGRNEQSAAVPWSATVFLTGNNLCTQADALRRFEPIFLDYGKMNPEARDPTEFRVFKEHGLHLKDYVEQHRPELVTAALTVVRGYLVANVPPANLEAVDFPEWERLVRQPVYYATGSDPCASHKELAADDETSAERFRLVNAWKALCAASGNPTGMTAEEAATWLAENQIKIAHLPLIITFAVWAKKGTKTPDASTLGYLLRSHKNTLTPCGKIKCNTEHESARRWFVSTT
jgi:putative DNA primase/helicase